MSRKFIKYNDRLCRILKENGEHSLIIDCMATRLPVWINNEVFDDLPETEIIASDVIKGILSIEEAELNPAQTAVINKRFTMIADILPVIENKLERAEQIKAAAKRFGVSIVTIRKSVIMALTGVGRNTFYKILKEREIPTGKSSNASDIETAVAMYRSGDTVKEILEKTGISNRRLYSEIAKRKIPRREKRSGSRHSDFYEKTKNHSDYIIEHYRQGENMTQIARALCMDYNTIKSVIDDAKDKKLIEEKRDCDIELEKERKAAKTIADVYMGMDKKPDVKEIAKLFKVDVNRLYYAIGKVKLEEE